MGASNEPIMCFFVLIYNKVGILIIFTISGFHIFVNICYIGHVSCEC